MQVLKVDAERPEKEVVEKAVKVLEIGGVVVYPTETVYGLGANIMDQGAIDRVFEIKGRDRKKPISIAFRDLEHVKKFVELSKVAERIAKFFLPGPLTIILPAKVPLGEMFGDDRIAVRIPEDKVAQAILKEVKFPVTATSANISGKKSPVDVNEAMEQIGEKVDLILDAGECKYGKPSTILDLTQERPQVLREGTIPKRRIIKFLK